MWERACSRRRRHIQLNSNRPTAFASRLAPTGICGVHHVQAQTQSQCGRELAREGVGTSNLIQTDPPPSRAGSLPQGFAASTISRLKHKANVGASLLAKASAHSKHVQTDPPLSRASSLPHGFAASTMSRLKHKSNVGASLLAKASAHSKHVQTDPPLSRASPLPHKLALTQARCYKGYTLNRATVSCSDPAICAKSWPAVSV